MNKASIRFGLTSLTPAVLILCIFMLTKGQRPKVYIINSSQNIPISQKIAVSVTEQVLTEAGIDVIMPKSYKENNLFKPNETERFFARDPHDPNNAGYVIWKTREGGIYKVSIKKSSNEFRCKITLIEHGSPTKLSNCETQSIRQLG